MHDTPRNILIYGGTFDPPHRAHVVLPPIVAAERDCDRILYVPAAINPLKHDGPPPTNAAHRQAMLRLAVADISGAVVSPIELNRAGPSYTIDTLRAIEDDVRYSECRMHVMIGSDQALQFHKWRSWREIRMMASLAVVLRPPHESVDAFVHAMRNVAINVEDGALSVDDWLDHVVHAPVFDVAATDLRERLRRGERPEDLMCPAVLDYIEQHALYRDAQ